MTTIDTDTEAADLTSEQLQQEFNDLATLADHPGFVRYKNTMQIEFDRCVNALFSDEMIVIDIASLFAREETIAQGKVLRKFVNLVDERREELKTQLEQNKRSKE